MKIAFVTVQRAILPMLATAALFLTSAPQATAAEKMGALSAKDAKALTLTASTPEDHQKLARHFTAMAEQHEAEAAQHEALAAEYTRNPQVSSAKHPMAPNSAEHCKYYAEHCRKTAAELRAMARQHEEQSKTAMK